MEYHLAETKSKDLNSMEHQWSNIGKRISSTVYFLCVNHASEVLHISLTYLVAKQTNNSLPSVQYADYRTHAISDNDVYRFEYNMKQGVVLEFERTMATNIIK